MIQAYLGGHVCLTVVRSRVDVQFLATGRLRGSREPSPVFIITHRASINFFVGFRSLDSRYASDRLSWSRHGVFCIVSVSLSRHAV